MLDKGFIRPSVSLIILLPKKDGTWRMCVDFRALNKITIKNRYPLPCIDDFVDQLKSCLLYKNGFKKWISSDLYCKNDVRKTTFKTKHELFEWLVMPFGLCNAPTTLIKVMNGVFRSYIDKFVIVYLDDILIFNSSWEEHIKHVKQVLEVLQREKLYLKMSKCEFGKTSLVYLGHIVGGGQLKMDPTKVEVIVK